MKLVQQRKNLVKRAFSGLVGLPPETEPQQTPLQEPAVVPMKPKAGRPSQGARTMTGAERTQKYREEKKKKLEDKERRDLVAQLTKIQKLMLPFADLESPQVHNVFAERRQRLQKIRDEWVLLPVAELQKTLGVYQKKDAEGRKLYIDSRGRLSGESSGEADRKNGMSGVERQIAKADGEGGGHDEGFGTAISNYNAESEPTTRAPRGIQTPKEHIAYLEDREEIITELIEQYVRKISLDDDQLACRCLLCGAKLPQLSDARQHFWVEYDKGLRMYYRYQELSEDTGVAEIAQFMIDDCRMAYRNHKHLQEVWRVSIRREAEAKATAISSHPKNSP